MALPEKLFFHSEKYAVKNLMKKHGHIIFSYSFNSEGSFCKLDNEAVANELKNDGLSWVHLDGTSKMTGVWLKKEVQYLDHLITDALLADETRPRITEFGNGFLIILRGVNLNHNDEPEDMVSIRMWIDSERIITVQKRAMKSVFDLRDQIESGKIIKNSAEFLYNLIYQILFVTSPFLYALNEKVDDLEEKIMTTHDAKFREELMQIRSQSAVFRRYLAPQKEVISKLKIIVTPWINDWSRRHFQENFDHISQMIEEIDEAASRSKILHDELANALSEKINRNMYKLSMITLIFMPLTFLTGLFGMNVGGIPGSDSPIAFYFCCVVMMLVALLQVFFFRRKDWF